MKKLFCLVFSLIIFALWCNAGFAQEKWLGGVISGKTVTTISIDSKTYNIIDDTEITDVDGNILDFKMLPNCCAIVNFIASKDNNLEKLIIDTKAGW